MRGHRAIQRRVFGAVALVDGFAGGHARRGGRRERNSVLLLYTVYCSCTYLILFNFISCLCQNFPVAVLQSSLRCA